MTSATVSVSSRGQVVVPAAFRKIMGLTAGAHLKVSYDDKRKQLIAVKEQDLGDQIDALAAKTRKLTKTGVAPLEDVHAFYDKRPAKA